MDQKKYQYLQSQIQEARNALQTWNDRRSEVMIELDSIFTELEDYKTKMEEERQNARSTIAELKVNLDRGEQEFHKHFEFYTNEMQELKLSNEELLKKNQSLQSEIEKSNLERKKREKEFQMKIEQVSSQADVRIADQQYQAKSQIANLVAELQSAQNEKKILIHQSKQYEKELHVIRNQMMSFLNVTKNVKGDEVSAPIVVSADSMNQSDAAQVESQMNANTEEPVMLFDSTSNPPTSVSDYLKRFGY